MRKAYKREYIRMAKEFHKDHGCIGAESFETCTAAICVMARMMEPANNGLQSDGAYCAAGVELWMLPKGQTVCSVCGKPPRR